MLLVQFLDEANSQKIGLVDDESIIHLKKFNSVYALFDYIFNNNVQKHPFINSLKTNKVSFYNGLFEQSKILLPVFHPDPYHTWITGTGLTHLGSAASRDAMHKKMGDSEESLTDSLKMFKMGVEDGQYQDGRPASQPEWFYKGNGLTAVAPGQPIKAPLFGWDIGEEPEIAGIYLIDAAGQARRIGFALGNEYSDHKMERHNYLYLSHSKLRMCTYGPEILVDDLPAHVVGKSRILREGKILWEKEFLTGENNMSHNLSNLEHHHFKYELFKQPGDLHVHFFGTSVLSFTDNIEIRNDDVVEVEAGCFAKPLSNKISISQQG